MQPSICILNLPRKEILMSKKIYRICIDEKNDYLNSIEEDEVINLLRDDMDELMDKVSILIDTVEDLIRTRDILKF